MPDESELTYEEVQEAQKSVKLAEVIKSLETVVYFEDLTEDGVRELKIVIMKLKKLW